MGEGRANDSANDCGQLAEVGGGGLDFNRRGEWNITEYIFHYFITSCHIPLHSSTLIV